MDKVKKPSLYNKYHSSRKSNNSTFCGTTQAKELIRQERIINAILDNDNNEWYSSTQTMKYNKRRNYSTFDGRATLNIQSYLEKERGSHMLKTQYF